MAQPSSGTLHGALLSALQDARTPQGPRTFSLTTLRSQPYRSYTLFPQATDQTKRVYKEDIQVLLAEQLPTAKSTEAGADAAAAPTTVPVYGLEASLYTVRETSTCLLYISKVDTTGLHPSQSPARLLTTAFLTYHLAHPPRSAARLRVHTFARAAREGQYLFPGSVDNVAGGPGEGAKGQGKKRLLDDKQLIRWWKNVLTDALRHTASPSSSSALRPSKATPVPEALLRAFYLLPGFDYAESLPLVPPSGPTFPFWVYGHPYSSLPSPLSDPLTPPSPTSASAPLSDLIPAFSDDPKARFLSSLASSNLSSSGEVNDWDDYTSSTLEALTSASILVKRKEEMEATRGREKARIDRVGVEEFWERMGARQECSDGRVSAFFVVAREAEGSKGSASEVSAAPHHISMHAEPGSVPRNVWTNLWSQVRSSPFSSRLALTSSRACSSTTSTTPPSPKPRQLTNPGPPTSSPASSPPPLPPLPLPARPLAPRLLGSLLSQAGRRCSSTRCRRSSLSTIPLRVRWTRARR